MLKGPDQKRAIRLDNLGDLYSLDCLDIRILYHTGELQNCVRLTDLQKAYGLVLGETITLKREGKNHTDIQRLAAQLAVISCEGIRSIGEVDGKAEAYRAECRRIGDEIEKLDKSSVDAEKRLSVLQNQYEKSKQHFDVYSDIVQTYRTISQGDYISKLVKEERKRQAAEKSRRKKNVSL